MWSLSSNRLPTYQYTPIDPSSRNFRLIRILPSQKPILPGLSGTVRIEIIQANFCSDILYDALSYVWNVPRNATKPNRRVMVETEYGPRELHIFRPLELALMHLEPTTSRLLFVDQICINQTDAGEKAHQVQLMRYIYSRCARGIIWLGPGTKASDCYFEYLKEITSEGVLSRVLGPRLGQFMNVFDAVMDPSRPVTEAEREDRDDILDMLSRYGDRFPLHGIVDVLERLWFSRLWTIQEACLPPELAVVCGRHLLCFDCFRSGILFYNLYNNHWLENLKRRVSHSELWRRNHILEQAAGVGRIVQERKAIHLVGRRQSLYDIILKYNINGTAVKIGATMAQDRLFGLLGLAKHDDELCNRIRVNYQVGVDQVYTEVAALLLEQNVDALLFSQSPKLSEAESKIPSWVPDWSMDLRVPCGYLDLSQPVFAAGGASEDKEVEFDEASRRIIIRGILVDEITHVGECTITQNPEDCIFEQLEYRSAKRFFDEASRFTHEAFKDRNGEDPSDDEDQATTLLQLSNAGLTIRYLASEMGQERGFETLRHLHQNISRVGEALIRSDDFIYSYHITRIIQTVGIRPWYGTPASEWDAFSLCARNPIAAGQIFLRGALDFLTDMFAICRSAVTVLVVSWGLKLRRRFLPRSLGPPTSEQLRNIKQRTSITLDHNKEHMAAFCSHLLKNTGRRLYRTSRGYVGIGPAEVQAGDSVVVFLGGTVPHVLRAESSSEMTDDGGIWSYVGEAYCDGIMDGEVVQSGSNESRMFALI